MVKLRDVPDSPEQKLPNCPFATESQTFPDSNSSWMTPSSSQGLSSPEPTEEGIIMVTPPDSEGSFDHNAPREDDNYQTPPEQYYSFATDSEDAKQPPPPVVVTTVCVDDDVQPMAVDLKEDEGSPGVQGSDGKELSFQLLPPPATSEGDRDNGDETMIAVEEGNQGLLGLELGQSSRGSGGDCVISVSRAPEKMESLRESVLKKAFETIENYKHASSSGAMEQRGKQKSVLGKCEAPSPKIGGKNAVQKEVPGGNDGIKGGSLKDILGKLELVMEKPKPKDSSEPDFFEKAKQQGVVFPRPRWWPPEGTDDDFQMA